MPSDFFSKVEEIANKFKISVHCTDVFEDYLVECSQITKPSFKQFSNFELVEGKLFIALRGITNEDTARFTDFLKKLDSSVQYRYEANPNCSQHPKQAHYFYLSESAVVSNILPAFEEHLNQVALSNPDGLTDYQSITEEKRKKDEEFRQKMLNDPRKTFYLSRSPLFPKDPTAHPILFQKGYPQEELDNTIETSGTSFCSIL